MDTASLWDMQLAQISLSQAMGAVLGTTIGLLLGWHLALAVVRGIVTVITDAAATVWPRRLPQMTRGERKTLETLAGGVDKGLYIRGLVIADADKRGVPWPIDE
jgi:predicted MFS family arabinose efflux permease